MKSTRTDPRFGTTTYTLNNVQRTEPSATLFTVPSDYTVQQGGPGRGARGAMTRRLPTPPPLNNISQHSARKRRGLISLDPVSCFLDSAQRKIPGTKFTAAGKSNSNHRRSPSRPITNDLLS